MTDETTLRRRLTEAEDALHRLTIGKSVTVASGDGSSITYAPAQSAQLRLHIAELKIKLGECAGYAPAMPRFF
ncbi:hypothetical protein N825_25355 [Skermanella stibiiresistens SB22]|uniref:Head-tail joining protein n=1 Tax=Skermanella stibiiresistens SB22 TaxID=1385369 RepID=W9GSN6_9PROT|nr:gpW family head-tail joining protein [Skermanella stibiiresistens]EWY36764.1 hypothetical protein N825_25355 [Skermanella stibiiresistens SB22]